MYNSVQIKQGCSCKERLKTIQQLHSTNNFFQGMSDMDNFICLKSISLTIQFSSVPLITGSPLLFVIITSLLHHQMLNSSASSPSSLPSPILLQVTLLIIFLPLTMLLFAYDICYPPCGLHVHTTSTYYLLLWVYDQLDAQLHYIKHLLL